MATIAGEEIQFYQIKSNNLGWTCPNCGRVFSPSTTECLYCNKSNKVNYSDYSVTNATISTDKDEKNS